MLQSNRSFCSVYICTCLPTFSTNYSVFACCHDARIYVSSLEILEVWILQVPFIVKSFHFNPNLGGSGAFNLRTFHKVVAAQSDAKSRAEGLWRTFIQSVDAARRKGSLGARNRTNVIANQRRLN